MVLKLLLYLAGGLLSGPVAVQQQQDAGQLQPVVDPQQSLDLFGGDTAAHQRTHIAAPGCHQLGHIKEAFHEDQTKLFALTPGRFIQQELILVVDFQCFAERIAPVFSIPLFLFFA